MRFDYPNWSSIHQPHWKKLLDYNLELTEPINMIEIGSFEGRSTVWFADYLTHEDSRLHCVDNWEGGEEFERTGLPYVMSKVEENFRHNINQHPNYRKISMWRSSSEEALSYMLRSDRRQIDFIYVDGSHTRRDTLVDLTLAMLLIRDGGLIIVDDYLNNMATTDASLQPKDAVDFVVKAFGNEVEFFTTPEQQAVIIRK